MAEVILPITRAANIALVINDHLAIAQEVGAEFCHLGQEDFFEHGLGVAERGSGKAGHGAHSDIPIRLDASAATGGVRIGLSSHAPAQAERAMAAGAPYIAIGPVYATGTKPDAKPVTLEYVRWAAAHVTRPWFAIGGINLQNLDQVLASGARRICVVSAILNATDVAGACHQFKERLLLAR
jgi:thiamine-phosphate pyrophosphorylase